MARDARRTPNSFTARRGQPLIAVLEQENGQEITRYFTEETTSATALDDDTRAALAAIGAWADLDWDEMEATLDRIRHESPRISPIDLSDLHQ